MKKLPIGIQTFERMRTEGFVYVDKTRYIATLVERGVYYFLSRPRRFGKSLFVDTLDCAFSARRKLFSELYLGSPESGWDWDRKSTVLRIDFAGARITSLDELIARLNTILDAWEKKYNLDHTDGFPGDRLLSFVPALAEKTGDKIVILIDEYDKPILDNIEKPEMAAEIRDGLRDFYGAIKPLDPYLRFVFLTGVSKFAKAGIFSGLNNLDDITIDARYSAICGYRQEDLETVFADRLSGFNSLEVRDWYNGYSWGGEPVYNPYDILLLFSKGTFRSWWFETGTPSFLIKLLTQKPRTLPDLDGMIAGDELLGSFRIEDLRPETLLFQTGYLTIRDWSSDAVRGTWYHLGFPNREVRQSFSRLLLGSFVQDESLLNERRYRLWTIMDSGNGEDLKNELQSLLSSLSHHWFTKNGIARYEGFYASVIYAFFASLGYEVVPEDTSNKGRADLTVKTPSIIWIFELKVKGLDKSGDKSPLAQIKERGYADKYNTDSREIREVGIIFDPVSRNIERWEVG